MDMFKIFALVAVFLWPRVAFAEVYNCAYLFLGEAKVSSVARENNAFRITTPDTPDGLVFNVIHESASELVLWHMGFIRKHMSVWYLDKDSGKTRSLTVPSPSFTEDVSFPEVTGTCMIEKE